MNILPCYLIMLNLFDVFVYYKGQHVPVVSVSKTVIWRSLVTLVCLSVIKGMATNSASFAEC